MRGCLVSSFSDQQGFLDARHQPRQCQINGNLEFDGRNASVQFEYSPDGWANMALTNQKISDLKQGSTEGINIGKDNQGR